MESRARKPFAEQQVFDSKFKFLEQERIPWDWNTTKVKTTSAKFCSQCFEWEIDSTLDG